MSYFQKSSTEYPLEPNNFSGTENCIEMWYFDRYYFNDADCTASKSPLCETTPVNSNKKIWITDSKQCIYWNMLFGRI